eukprot:6182557-Pleurochrysis_carterae.AAC.2
MKRRWSEVGLFAMNKETSAYGRPQASKSVESAKIDSVLGDSTVVVVWRLKDARHLNLKNVGNSGER